MELECGVCCSTSTKIIKCIECKYEACCPCVEKYLLNVNSDPHCMNCRQSWDILFLRTNLDKIFLDGVFKEHWKKILLKRSNRHRDNDFLCPCPACPYGKISRSSMRCSSCWVGVCGKCLVPDTHNHICKQEIVLSLDKIGQMTRRCPGCRVPIEKKSGCFQMFCTNCHTAFDWNNGDVLQKQNLHNPHYFAHQKHQSLLDSFHISLNNLKDYSFKWVCKEFYNLIMEIETQIKSNEPGGGEMECGEFLGNELFDRDEARRRRLCQYLLWVNYHKRGFEIVKTFVSSADNNRDFLKCKINCFITDLKNVLIDFNEHVAECLQLRGYRLFPCNPPVLCM